MEQQHHKRSILFIEDDARQFEGLSDFLSPNGFRVYPLPENQNPLAVIESIKPHLVLLDVMLPGEKNGFDILRDIRAKLKIPVIMLTARGSEVDKVVGLEMGADDYLAKPAHPHELLARIRAVLRRSENNLSSADSGMENKDPTIIVSGDFRLDVLRAQLDWRGKATKITSSEISILKTLMKHPNETLERDRLLQLAFGDSYYAINRTIDVHISHLRSSIRNFSADLDPIRTVWRVGYSWVPNG
jgi:two-component system phosphate regulon response regulator OmpR